MPTRCFHSTKYLLTNETWCEREEFVEQKSFSLGSQMGGKAMSIIGNSERDASIRVEIKKVPVLHTCKKIFFVLRHKCRIAR